MPRQILRRAAAHRVGLLAVTDHNSAAHIPVLHRLAPEFGVILVPGIEITTREEVHLLGYFESPAPLLDFTEMLESHLPELPNDDDFFGYQLQFDEHDELVGVDERLRHLACDLGLDRLVEEIHSRNGVAIPAHVFRKRYSMSVQLGFIPEKASFDALEIATAQWRSRGYSAGSRVHGYPVVTGSDAHFLEDVGRGGFDLPAPVDSIRKLLHTLNAGSGSSSDGLG